MAARYRKPIHDHLPTLNPPQLRASADAAPEARQQRQAAAASPRRHWSWKQVWFQLHWFIGITAGTVLVVIGLSGATLAFKDELLDLMNPGVRHVPVETHAPLTPGQLSSIAAAEHGQRVASITMYAEAGAAPRLFFAPKQASDAVPPFMCTRTRARPSRRWRAQASSSGRNPAPLAAAAARAGAAGGGRLALCLLGWHFPACTCAGRAVRWTGARG
jgi:hypothetical protein